MLFLILLGVLVLTIGGCVCVVWAERGGPRWTRPVATATLAAARLVSSSRKKGLRPGPRGSSGDDG